MTSRSELPDTSHDFSDRDERDQGLGEKFDREAEYEKLMGKEALERQQHEAELRFSCCGQFKEKGHAQLCRWKGKK